MMNLEKEIEPKTIMVFDTSRQDLYLYELAFNEPWEVEKFVQEKDHSADSRVVVIINNFKDLRHEK